MNPVSEIQPMSVIRRTKDISFSRLDDEFLAVDVQAGYCYSLSETAGRVWDLLATPMSLDALSAQLQAEYIVDDATCRREVLALVQVLREAKLVQVSDAATN